MKESEDRTIRGGTLYTRNLMTGLKGQANDTVRKRIQFSSSSVDGDFKNPNPFSFTKNEVSYPYISGQSSIVRKSDGKTTSITQFDGAVGETVVNNRQFLPVSMASLSFSDELDQSYAQAQARLVQKLKDSDLMTAVMAAEAPELATLKRQLNHNFDPKRVRRLAAKFPFLGPATLIADAWLIWVFALKPTIHDAWNLATYVRDDLTINPLIAKASASVNLDKRSTNTTTHYRQMIRGRVKTKFGVLYDIQDEATWDRTRLGLNDPYSYAWERLPFSFAIDYFVNIGGYLSNVESAYARGLKFRKGWMTQTYKVLATRDYYGHSWSDVYSNYSDNITGRTERDLAYCNRQVLTSFPSARVPSLDLDLGSGQLLNIAALLQSIFVSRR